MYLRRPSGPRVFAVVDTGCDGWLMEQIPPMDDVPERMFVRFVSRKPLVLRVFATMLPMVTEGGVELFLRLDFIGPENELFYQHYLRATWRPKDSSSDLYIL